MFACSDSRPQMAHRAPGRGLVPCLPTSTKPRGVLRPGKYCAWMFRIGAVVPSAAAVTYLRRHPVAPTVGRHDDPSACRYMHDGGSVDPCFSAPPLPPVLARSSAKGHVVCMLYACDQCWGASMMPPCAPRRGARVAAPAARPRSGPCARCTLLACCILSCDRSRRCAAPAPLQAVRRRTLCAVITHGMGVGSQSLGPTVQQGPRPLRALPPRRRIAAAPPFRSVRAVRAPVRLRRARCSGCPQGMPCHRLGPSLGIYPHMRCRMQWVRCPPPTLRQHPPL